MPNNNSAGFLLEFDFYFYPPGPALPRVVALRIPMQAPVTGTFATSGGMSGTWAGLRVDTAFYVSIAGGTIAITKFDTINNVISGTFSFDGTDGSLSEHVTGGYFSQVPIYYGAFTQGLITADISDYGIKDTFISTGTFPAPILYTIDSGKTFMIIAHDDDALTQREIRFGLTNIGVGSTDLDQSSGGGVFGEYKAFGARKAQFNTTAGATGNITITNFDWKTHRMSATFNLSFSPFVITNGKIDNVQWDEL